MQVKRHPLGQMQRQLYMLTLTMMVALWMSPARVLAAEPPAIVALGDSLTAGYGLAPGDGFTEQLSVWLAKETGAPVTVVNAGVSGDTSAGGRARLDWALAPVKGGRPDLVLVALGGNDGLRGLDPAMTRREMTAIATALQAKDIPFIVIGMLAPPNLGPDYAAAFNSIFSDIAKDFDAPLYPFFLEGVAADPAYNQADGIHPNKEGVARIISKLGPLIKKTLTASVAAKS